MPHIEIRSYGQEARVKQKNGATFLIGNLGSVRAQFVERNLGYELTQDFANKCYLRKMGDKVRYFYFFIWGDCMRGEMPTEEWRWNKQI